MKDLIEKKIRQCSAELAKLIPEWNKRRDTLRRIFAIRQGLFTRSNSKNDHGLLQNHSISSPLVSDSVEVKFKRR
jgi:hypothetical protein